MFVEGERGKEMCFSLRWFMPNFRPASSSHVSLLVVRSS
jgi:hypothetical protein